MKTNWEEITWAQTPRNNIDVIRFESTKMDYIRMLNSIEISGERGIVTELIIELPMYPLRDQV